MPKMSGATKSFIILFTIAMVGTYICLALYWQLGEDKNYSIPYNAQEVLNGGTQNQPQQNVIPEKAVDISQWKDYTNKDYNFSFKYAPDWKVLPVKKVGNFKVIEIDPGKKYYNFKIYISEKEFYVMDGLPLKDETIGGFPAKNLNDILYGVVKPPYYFTFDIGYSLSLRPQFDAMVKSVTFVK